MSSTSSAGFEYFERTAERPPVPVIDAAPVWHHLDEPTGAKVDESPHSVIVRQVGEDFANSFRVQLITTCFVTAAAGLLCVAVGRYEELRWLASWATRALWFTSTLSVSLALSLHYVRKITGRALERIGEHETREAVGAWRREIDNETP